MRRHAPWALLVAVALAGLALWPRERPAPLLVPADGGAPAVFVQVAVLPQEVATPETPLAQPEPGQPVSPHRGAGTVGEIYVVGNTRTVQSVIRAQLPFDPGDPFTEADLRVAERLLERLRVFRPGPRVRVMDRGDEHDVKDIIVEVQERG